MDFECYVTMMLFSYLLYLDYIGTLENKIHMKFSSKQKMKISQDILDAVHRRLSFGRQWKELPPICLELPSSIALVCSTEVPQPTLIHPRHLLNVFWFSCCFSLPSSVHSCPLIFVCSHPLCFVHNRPLCSLNFCFVFAKPCPCQDK